MAIIKNSNGDTLKVPNGEKCVDQLEGFGVPFGCQQGNCHTCLTTIVSGMENIEEMSEMEVDGGLEENQRLMCQCKFKEGEIEIDH